MDNMPGCSYDSIKDLNSRISHTHSKKVIKHALRQQAKRRRKNTTIAAGNSNPSIVVKSLPPRGEAKESTKPATMREVLASIPGFSIKPRKRSNKKLSAAAQLEQTKEGCIDLETPDSILVHTNLRALLNKHTFSSLPPLYQYKLVQLLPDVDRPGGALSDSSLRISASGLNNEFFARACLEWRERLAEGEFTPENQQKLKAEAEKEMSRLDPWKLKHFEPIWGEKQEPTTDTTPLLLPSPARPSLKTTIKLRPSTSNRHPKIMPSLTRRLRTVGAVTRAITSYRDRHQESLGITEKRPVENENEEDDDAQHKKLKSIPDTCQEMQQDEESTVVKSPEEASPETKTEANAIKDQEFEENELESTAENKEEDNKPQKEEVGEEIMENNAKEQTSMSEDEIDMQEEEEEEEDEEEEEEDDDEEEEEEEEEEETEESEVKRNIEVTEADEMQVVTESRNSPELKEESQNAAAEVAEVNKESVELSESYVESDETEAKVVEVESASIDGENAMYEPTAIPEADVIHETAILQSTEFIEVKMNVVVNKEDVTEENKENIAVDNNEDNGADDSEMPNEGDDVAESTEKSIKNEQNVTIPNGMAENDIVENKIHVRARDLTEPGDDLVASDRNSVELKEESVSRNAVEVDADNVSRSSIENKEETTRHQPATLVGGATVSENEDTVVIEDSEDSVVKTDKADNDAKESETAEAKMVEMSTETSSPAVVENTGTTKTEDVDANEEMRAVLMAAAQECCWEMVDSSTEKLLSEVPLTLPVALAVVEDAEPTEEVEVIPMQEELEVRLEEGTFPVATEDWPYAVKMDSAIVAVTMDEGGEVPTSKETQVQYPEYSTSQAVKLELEVTLTPEVVTSAESLVTSTVGGSGPNCSTAATSSSGPPPVAKSSVATVIPPTTIVCLPSAVPPPNLMHRATQLAKTVASSSAVPYLSVSSNTPVRALPTQIPKSQSKSKQGSQVSSGSGGNRGSRSSSNKPPPGAVNLERSYQICQAVIQNSPNRDQLRCQLKPPPSLLAANSNAAAVTGNGSKKSESSSRAATQYGVVTSSRNGASKPFTPPLPAAPAVGGYPVLPGNNSVRNGMGTQGKVMGSRGIYQQPPPVVVRHVFTSSQGIPVTMAVLPQAQAPPEVAESPHVGQYILVQRTGVGDQVVRKGAPPPPRASSAPPSNNGGRPGGALGLGRGRPASVDVQQHGIEYVPNSYGEHFIVQCPNPGTQAITKKNNSMGENICGGGIPYADASDPVVQSYTIINPNTNADNQNYNRPAMPTARTAQRTDPSQCACNLKAMIMCKKCGAFCHDDCIGPSRLCVTCLIR